MEATADTTLTAAVGATDAGEITVIASCSPAANPACRPLSVADSASDAAAAAAAAGDAPDTAGIAGVTNATAAVRNAAP